jgi:hypothetical protein
LIVVRHAAAAVRWFENPGEIQVADGTSVPSLAIGRIGFLKGVYYVPEEKHYISL